MMVPLWLAVAGGGALGALLRHGINSLVHVAGFPLATYLINIAGSFILALFVGWVSARGHAPAAVQAFVAIGVLGGFTTFSTFTMESMLLIQRGQIGLALFYISTSIGLSLAAFALGMWLMRLNPTF